MIRWGDSVLEAVVEKQGARLDQHVTWLQRRVEQLTDQIVAMKRDGYTYTPSERYEPMKEEPLPSVIQQAISRRAGPDEEMVLEEWARSQLAAGWDQEVLADRILKGGME
jgi:hypothetical protein